MRTGETGEAGQSMDQMRSGASVGNLREKSAASEGRPSSASSPAATFSSTSRPAPLGSGPFALTASTRRFCRGCRADTATCFPSGKDKTALRSSSSGRTAPLKTTSTSPAVRSAVRLLASVARCTSRGASFGLSARPLGLPGKAVPPALTANDHRCPAASTGPATVRAVGGTLTS